jgi:hypothetical protein
VSTLRGGVQDDPLDGLEQAAADQRAGARLGNRRAHQAADQGVRGRGRDAVVPGDDVPDDRAHEGAKHHILVNDMRVDGTRTHRLGHVDADGEDGDEVEQRGHGNRGLGFQHPGRHHRRNRVGGVVEAVHEVEDQR